MSNPDPRAEIAKIEETIRNLQKLKEQGVLPAEQADTSIAALKHQLASYSAKLEGDGGLAQGAGAKAVGRDGILIEGNVYMGPEAQRIHRKHLPSIGAYWPAKLIPCLCAVWI